jgi:hypothetical protein
VGRASRARVYRCRRWRRRLIFCTFSCVPSASTMNKRSARGKAFSPSFPQGFPHNFHKMVIDKRHTSP